MEMAIAVLAALFLVMVSVTVLVVVRLARRTRRGIERARGTVRRTLTDAALTARAAQPGVLGELARTRREVRASLESTRGTLKAVAAHDPAVTEALALLDQLTVHAERLDGELALLMAGEPDRPRLAARLPALRERAERIKGSADALRAAAQDRAQHDDADGLDALHRQIELEAGALRHWDPAREPQIPPAPRTPQVPPPGRKAVGDADQDRSS